MRPSTIPSALPPTTVGLACAFLAAALFAMLNVAIRLAEPYMTIWHIMLGRSLFGIVAMLLLARSMEIRILGVHRRLLLSLGLAGVTGVTCLTGALMLLPLFEALVLIYLYPAFAAILSPWLTGDRMTRRDWGFIVLATLGTAIVLWTGDLKGRLQWGHLLALAAAFFYGLTITLTRRASKANTPLTPFFYISAVGGIACLVPLLWQPQPLWPAVQGLPALGGVAVLATAAHLATNKALSSLPSPQVGVISMLEVVFTGVLGLVLFREPLGLQALTGGALILAGGIGLNMAGRRCTAAP